MTEPVTFKTVHASVRPARVAVLTDKADDDWRNTCLRIIEFFSRIWGGAYNIIIPTDGNSIHERFWALLEAYDPDYLYSYQKTGEDLRLNKPDDYGRILDARLGRWMAEFGKENPENATLYRQEIDKDLRRSSASSFAIAAELQNEVKVRLAPFHLEPRIVEATVTADSPVSFPLTDLAKIIRNTDHPNRFSAISAPAGLIPELWYRAVAGSFNENATLEFEALGILRDQFDFSENDLAPLIELGVTGTIRESRVFQPGVQRFFDLDGITPFRLSMLELGLYRSNKYPYWTEPTILVAGSTLEDFCLYYCLARLRDRVVWILPSITQKALNAASWQGDFGRVWLHLAAALARDVTTTGGGAGVYKLFSDDRRGPCSGRAPQLVFARWARLVDANKR